MNEVRTTVEGERFLHRELWAVVERQLDHATGTPRGSAKDHLVAMVFAFNTLEAYLNYAGEQLAPQIWKDERNFFRGEPYRGFDGKVRKVLELVGLAEPTRTDRPYSTVWMLKDLRDLIAHAKPLKFSYVIEHAADDKPSMFHSPMKDVVTPENAEIARTDIKAFIEQIHVRAVQLVEDVYFRTPALGGITQYASHHSSPSDGSSTP